uniref:Uncharacterized protein n=1 Tax=Avena sativa TaxID=4498 RepID=A0ACD6A8D2_AVESA
MVPEPSRVRPAERPARASSPSPSPSPFRSTPSPLFPPFYIQVAKQASKAPNTTQSPTTTTRPPQLSTTSATAISLSLPRLLQSRSPPRAPRAPPGPTLAMSHKRPLDAVVPEQEAPRSPRKRLRRTVLVMMWLERRRRRARALTLEQMVRQLDMAKLFFFLMVIVGRLSSMETLLLQLPNMLQGLLAQQFATVHSSIMGSIQDTIRSVLRTEIQERQAALLPNGVYEPSREISEGLPENGSISGLFKLQFVDAQRPNDPLYTGSPVKWQDGENAKVAIFRNGKQIMDGDLSKLQIEILPVPADFFTEQGQSEFPKEEFNKKIYSYKGKESVLTTVNLKNGEAYLGSFFFTESSYGKKLRLIARVKRHLRTVRVQEAITDPFVVKDRRSESNEKSNLPSKGDAVHQLKKISQKGKRCIALTGEKITTVKHLLRQYHKDKAGLQKLTGMKKEDWGRMINHATTCDPGNETYSYRVAEGELLFNDFYNLVGMMINGLYIPVRDLDQFQQLKLNNWKMSAYKKFDERENSGGLVPDYLMRNGYPVHAVPLNNEAGPSVQGASLIGQQNGYLSSLTADAFGTSCPVTVVELGQHNPSMPQNGIPYYLAEGNNLNGQVSFSGQTTIPSILSPVLEDDLITGASLTDQQNGYLSSLMTDAPSTSCSVTDGVNQGISSLNHVPADILSALPPIELQLQELLELQAHLEYQGFIQANNEGLQNYNNQFDDNEHDGGNR